MIERAIMALPGQTRGSGPFPHGPGGWSVDPRTLSNAERTAAASLYAALSTEAVLRNIGADGPTIVEGPFFSKRSLSESAARIDRATRRSAGRGDRHERGAPFWRSAPMLRYNRLPSAPSPIGPCRISTGIVRHGCDDWSISSGGDGMTCDRPDAAPAISNDPALEIILRGPGESIRWAKHDYPHHLAKWHRHPEYELHLVTAGPGRMMVGDYVGTVPGGLPRPRRSQSSAQLDQRSRPGTRLPDRDVLVQFDAAICDTLVNGFSEFSELRALLRDAAFGVEFLGETAEQGRRKLCAMEHQRGAGRLVSFLSLLAGLAPGRKSGGFWRDTHRRSGSTPPPRVASTA